MLFSNSKREETVTDSYHRLLTLTGNDIHLWARCFLLCRGALACKSSSYEGAEQIPATKLGATATASQAQANSERR